MKNIRSISLVLATLGLAACGGSQPAPELPAEPPADAAAAAAEPKAEAATEKKAEAAPARKLITDELVAAHDACFENWIKGRDEKGYAACYNEDSTEEFMGSGEKPLKGAKAIFEDSKGFWTAFPDLNAKQILTLASGNKIATLIWLAGTNTGEFAGGPATGKKFATLGVEVVDSTPDGKHQASRIYADMSSMMGQLGKNPAPHRKLVAEPKDARIIKIAKSDEFETKNVERVKGLYDIWNKREWKGWDSAFAKDVLFSCQTLPADAKGAKGPGIIKDVTKAFTNGQIKATSIWAAGEYVVAETVFTGKNDGPSKEWGMKKGTGRDVTIPALHIWKLDGTGAVSEYRDFSNGMGWAAQLGFLDAPKAAEPAKADAKKGDAKKEEPKAAAAAKPADAAKPAAKKEEKKK